MNITALEQELNKLTHIARDLGYTINKPTLFVDPVFGNKLAYYSHGKNTINIHDHFVENGEEAEVMNTLIHEMAHAVAEQNNTNTDKNGKIKHVWHGEAWKI